MSHEAVISFINRRSTVFRLHRKEKTLSAATYFTFSAGGRDDRPSGNTNGTIVLSPYTVLENIRKLIRLTQHVCNFSHFKVIVSKTFF